MLVFEAILERLPEWLSPILLSVPSTRLERLRSYMKTARKVAKEVVERQTARYLNGKEGSKDIMSILGNFDIGGHLFLRHNLHCVKQSVLTWRKILSRN
jgi:hypothetical protein